MQWKAALSPLMLAVTSVMLVIAASSVWASSQNPWGALAVDSLPGSKSPYYGTGDGNSEDEASNNAQRFCSEAGGAQCKVVVTYRDCGAYAVSSTTIGTGTGETKSQAEKKALSACKKADCTVVASDCT